MAEGGGYWDPLGAVKDEGKGESEPPSTQSTSSLPLEQTPQPKKIEEKDLEAKKYFEELEVNEEPDITDESTFSQFRQDIQKTRISEGNEADGKAKDREEDFTTQKRIEIENEKRKLSDLRRETENRYIIQSKLEGEEYRTIFRVALPENVCGYSYGKADNVGLV